MRRLPAVLSVFTLFAAAAAAQMYPSTWKLAHPDAKALIGVDLRSLRESQAGKSFGGEIDKAGAGMFHVPGMELLNEIDQVFISSPGQKMADTKGNPPFLIVLTGHFASEQVKQLFGRPYRAYSTFDLYGSAEAGKLSVAMLDNMTLVLGDEPSVRGAIDRSGQRPAAAGELLQRASAMAKDHDFWVIATVPPSAFQPANTNLGPLASDILGLDAGLSLREGLRFELDLSTKTPGSAKALSQQLAAMVTLAIASNPDVQEGADIVRKLEVGSEETRMSVKLALNQEEVDRMIHTMKARQNVSSVQPPPDDKPKTIKIVGLDEGVREIPFGPKD